ncbi:MAG: hypothetical protein JXX28_01160 [Deltaproteobacteria bacterium]|nr:hypothetical protein [Deltaproteobacteria bacterium]
MADATAGFRELMATLGPLAKTGASRELLVEMVTASGVRVDADLNPVGRVTSEQLLKVVEGVDVKAVWKLAARRVMRQYA